MFNKRNTQKRRPLMLSLLLGAAVGGTPLLAAANANGINAKPGSVDPNDWPQYHRTWNAWRYSPLSQVNAHNVKRLKVAWIHQPGYIKAGLVSTPLEKDGVLYYVASNNNVFAVNAATGATIWHYQPDLDPIANKSFYAFLGRSLTMGHGMIYLGTLDGRFVAINRKTGKQVWSTQLTDLKKCFGCLFSSSPVLAGDVLIGGTTGGDQPTQGKIYAVNALTGKRMWTFNVIKNDPKSWAGDSGKVGGSGAWLPGTYDPSSDTVFIGTSNPAPDFYGDGRKGNNKYSDTLLALDPQTGRIKWYRQEVPHGTYDYDSTYEAVVIDKDGKQYIVHLNKGGFVYVMNASNGKLDNVWPLSESYNWVKKIDPTTGRLIGEKKLIAGKDNLLCPYLLGTRSWNPGAYNPETGLWYTNAMEVCEIVNPGPQNTANMQIASLYLGASKLEAVPPPNMPAEGRLDARDPFTGKLKWSIKYKIPSLGGVLTTAGNLVFNGTPDGLVHAYNAETGKELWHFQTGSGIRAGIISYAVHGKQYIVVPSGWGSLAPGFMTSVFPGVTKIRQGGVVIAFTLE